MAKKQVRNIVTRNIIIFFSAVMFNGCASNMIETKQQSEEREAAAMSTKAISDTVAKIKSDIDELVNLTSYKASKNRKTGLANTLPVQSKLRNRLTFNGNGDASVVLAAFAREIGAEFLVHKKSATNLNLKLSGNDVPLYTFLEDIGAQIGETANISFVMAKENDVLTKKGIHFGIKSIVFSLADR